MRKMTTEDVEVVVDFIRKWKRAPLRWETLQKEISLKLLSGDRSWSRQSLQANESINVAWLAAKRRLSAKGKQPQSTDTDEPLIVEQLEAALSELQSKYDNLAMRHRQLVYNASM